MGVQKWYGWVIIGLMGLVSCATAKPAAQDESSKSANNLVEISYGEDTGQQIALSIPPLQEQTAILVVYLYDGTEHEDGIKYINNLTANMDNHVTAIVNYPAAYNAVHDRQNDNAIEVIIFHIQNTMAEMEIGIDKIILVGYTRDGAEKDSFSMRTW
jgi:hypothetical protein